MFCFFVLVFVLVDLTEGRQCLPRNDWASTSSRCHGSTAGSSSCPRRGSPRDFVSLFVVSSWPSGAFFLSSGWAGFPLPCFPFPRRCGSSFFWVGWVPLPRFPGVFPMVLGWLGGRVLCFVSPAISCVLHLFSLSCN